MFERQIFIDDFLIEYAYLMIDFRIPQLAESLFCRDNTILIVFNGVNDVIICHTALYYIILFLHFTSVPTIYHILKPFEII